MLKERRTEKVKGKRDEEREREREKKRDGRRPYAFFCKSVELELLLVFPGNAKRLSWFINISTKVLAFFVFQQRKCL